MAIGYGFLSAHPPTRSGSAAFNAGLAAALNARGCAGGVVRMTTAGDDQRQAPGVVHTWPAGAGPGWQGAAEALNAFDVAVVQHEPGLYPGNGGGDVLPLLRRLTVPSIVVLHAVPTRPTPGHRSLLEAVVAAAGVVVTMGAAAQDRLLHGYTVDAAKVVVIPHGTTDHVTEHPPVPRRERPHLLTWGLLGPGKGVEWTLRALAQLQDLDPTLTVAGQTHPKVVERHGEAYRAGLHRLGAQLGVAHAVDYQAFHHDEAALGGLIRSADVVVLPYDDPDQVTSGGARRGGGGRCTDRRLDVPARHRAARWRPGPAGGAPEPGGPRQGPPAGPHRPRGRRPDGPLRPAAGALARGSRAVRGARRPSHRRGARHPPRPGARERRLTRAQALPARIPELLRHKP